MGSLSLCGRKDHSPDLGNREICTATLHGEHLST